MRSWEHIYIDNSEKLKGVCRRYVKSEEVAEDIMHDAFEIAIQKIDSYSGRGSFEGWLYQITINTALQYLRNNKRTVSKTDELLDYHIEKSREQERSENKRSQIHEANFEVSDLLNALDLLPEHHKIVFNLYVLEKKSHKEIAELLNISINTSKSHLNRARKKLQDVLFEKAKNKEKDNLKKYLLLFFPFYFSVDTLYARELKKYSPKLKVQRVIFPKFPFVNDYSSIKLKKLATLVTFIALVGGFIFIQKKESKEQTYKKEEITVVLEVKENLLSNAIKEIDSLIVLLKKENMTKRKEVKRKDFISKSEPVVINVPVVVHKQIIVKDTLSLK